MWPLKRDAEEHDDSFTVGDSPGLVVRSHKGRVQVSAGPPRTVRVQATVRKASSVHYRTYQEGDSVKVDVEVTRRSGGADLVIAAPLETTVDLETNDGSIRLEGITAHCRVHSSDGRVELRDLSGDLDASTNKGAVEVFGLVGSAMVRTSNGSARLRMVRGSVDVATVNGSIDFIGELPAGSASVLEAADGGVRMKLEGRPSLKLDASATNGGVSSSLPIVASVKEGSDLIGTVGTGEADLRIRAYNGSISIR